MKHREKDNAKIDSVVAVFPGHGLNGPFRGISLAKSGDGFKLVTCMTASAEQGTFPGFVEEFNRTYKGRADRLVLAADPGAVSFYRITIPPVRASQAEAIISMQAEGLVPVAMDRMRTGYRVDPVAGDKCPVTLAVAAKPQVEECIEVARSVSAQAVVVSAEAVVAAWRKLFGDGCDDAVLVYIQQDGSMVLNVSSGRLCGAVAIEVGQRQLCSENGVSSRSLFAHDLRQAITTFSSGLSSNVFVLAADRWQYDELIEELRAAKINADISVPVEDALLGGDDFDSEKIIEYIEPIGACFVAIDAQCGYIDFVKGDLDKNRADEKTDSLKSLAMPFLILLVILAVSLVTAKAVDKSRMARLKSPEIDKIIENQKIRKLVAQNRLDFIELLSKVEAALPSGMKISSFSCEREKAISLSSTAPSLDQMLELQEKLKAQNGISEVNIATSRKDEKSGAIEFKMTFYYKDYTKKSSGL